jgi:flavin reductase (DIM6/NTAB) family NADH-FMN oxidoreductase RutF
MGADLKPDVPASNPRDGRPDRRGLASITHEAFVQAMRALAGGVVVVTVGMGEARTGFTASSLVALSAETPTIIVLVSLSTSAWPAMRDSSHFGVSLLAAKHAAVARRFSGYGDIKGAARFDGAEWLEHSPDSCTLKDAPAGFECAVDEVLPRYDHAIVIARVTAIHTASLDEPLAYWNGSFQGLRPLQL